MVLNCQNYRPFYKDMYTTRMMKVLIKYSDKSLKLLQVWWKWPDARWLSVKLTSIFTTSVQPMVLESSLILLSKLYGHPNFVINDTRPVFNIFCYNCSRISVCSGFHCLLLVKVSEPCLNRFRSLESQLRAVPLMFIIEFRKFLPWY